jgi:hypothetical protein
MTDAAADSPVSFAQILRRLEAAERGGALDVSTPEGTVVVGLLGGKIVSVSGLAGSVSLMAAINAPEAAPKPNEPGAPLFATVAREQSVETLVHLLGRLGLVARFRAGAEVPIVFADPLAIDAVVGEFEARRAAWERSRKVAESPGVLWARVDDTEPRLWLRPPTQWSSRSEGPADVEEALEANVFSRLRKGTAPPAGVVERLVHAALSQPMSFRELVAKSGLGAHWTLVGLKALVHAGIAHGVPKAEQHGLRALRPWIPLLFAGLVMGSLAAIWARQTAPQRNAVPEEVAAAQVMQRARIRAAIEAFALTRDTLPESLGELVRQGFLHPDDAAHAAPGPSGYRYERRGDEYRVE